jgi:hypothetical protein
MKLFLQVMVVEGVRVMDDTAATTAVAVADSQPNVEAALTV